MQRASRSSRLRRRPVRPGRICARPRRIERACRRRDAWLARAAQAARKLDYVGTIIYQIGPRVESSRITHLNDDGREYAKLVNLDGPAREVVRNDGEVRSNT